jgi:hypothetical protein
MISHICRPLPPAMPARESPETTRWIWPGQAPEGTGVAGWDAEGFGLESVAEAGGSEPGLPTAVEPFWLRMMGKEIRATIRIESPTTTNSSG